MSYKEGDVVILPLDLTMTESYEIVNITMVIRGAKIYHLRGSDPYRHYCAFEEQMLLCPNHLKRQEFKDQLEETIDEDD